MRKKQNMLAAVLVLALILVATFAFARAGGAGGSRSGGGGSGEGVIFLIWMLIRVIIYLPFPLNIIVAGLIIVIALVVRKKMKQQTVLNKLPAGAGKPLDRVKGYKSFAQNNPDFKEAEFKKKVRTAFLQIQQAWEAQDISKVRKFLSDGVYQRFNTQFRMMQLLKQKNTLDKVEIKNIYIDAIESDGLYDIVHVAIQASIVDKFISELDSSLNSGGAEEFVEYWSFLRKRGVPAKDMYNSPGCPNCGAELPEGMGELSKCEYCGTLLNSGEFDWVLSEITQADDYVGKHGKLQKTRNLNDKIRELVQANEDFSVQLLEDKASNGYLQILTATAVKDAAVMRRFVSDQLFAKLQARLQENPAVYNRIYLNDVSLIGVREEANQNVLLVSVRSSFQRVRIEGNKVHKLDEAVISKTDVLVMVRDKGAGATKGSLYAHNCPSCGAPVENSLEIRCTYCDKPLNSPSSEWIINDIMSRSEARDYMEEHSRDFSYQVDPNLLDKTYDVRDFAFNNVMVMIGADGVFAEEEMTFAKEVARKWGYNVNQIQPMFQMAQAGRLAVRMPEKMKARKRIYRLMEKAAMADQNLAEQERLLLENVRKQFLQDEEKSA